MHPWMPVSNSSYATHFQISAKVKIYRYDPGNGKVFSANVRVGSTSNQRKKVFSKHQDAALDDMGKLHSSRYTIRENT